MRLDWIGKEREREREGDEILSVRKCGRRRRWRDGRTIDAEHSDFFIPARVLQTRPYYNGTIFVASPPNTQNGIKVTPIYIFDLSPSSARLITRLHESFAQAARGAERIVRNERAVRAL